MPFVVILGLIGFVLLRWNIVNLVDWLLLARNLVGLIRVICIIILVLVGDRLGRGIIRFNLGVIVRRGNCCGIVCSNDMIEYRVSIVLRGILTDARDCLQIFWLIRVPFPCTSCDYLFSQRRTWRSETHSSGILIWSEAEPSTHHHQPTNKCRVDTSIRDISRSLETSTTDIGFDLPLPPCPFYNTPLVGVYPS